MSSTSATARTPRLLQISGCALATVASSGAIGAATQAPLAAVLTPRTVVMLTAGIGLAVGLAVAIAAHVSPNSRDD